MPSQEKQILEREREKERKREKFCVVIEYKKNYILMHWYGKHLLPKKKRKEKKKRKKKQLDNAIEITENVLYYSWKKIVLYYKIFCY